jgi:hypothetical protein
MIHEIKISPHQFERIWDINQSFLIVKSKDINKNDVLQLREYSPQRGFTGRRINTFCTDVHHSDNPSGEGLKKDYCLVQLSEIQKFRKHINLEPCKQS